MGPVTPISEDRRTRRERIVSTAMKDGMLAERRRIVEWLDECQRQLDAEPTTETPEGDEMTPLEKKGALGMIAVLRENLAREL